MLQHSRVVVVVLFVLLVLLIVPLLCQVPLHLETQKPWKPRVKTASGVGRHTAAEPFAAAVRLRRWGLRW